MMCLSVLEANTEWGDVLMFGAKATGHENIQKNT